MRPTILHVGNVLRWVINTRNPDTMLLKDADATPTVTVRKNGASTGDSVTITKRAATTGIYDCEYNPAGEIEGDMFNIREVAQVTGTTTPQATYEFAWPFTVVSVMRGTDGANTIAPATSSEVTAAKGEVLAAVEAIEGGGTNGTGEYRITVTALQSTNDAAVNGVRVSIAGTTTHDTTGTLGVAELNVDDGETYTLQITPPPGYEPVDDVEVEIDGANESVPIELVPTTVASTPIVGTCEIIDYVLDSGREPVAGASIRAIASEDAVLSDVGILTQLATKATTDSNGRFVLRLARADAMTAGKEYTIEIKHQAKSIYRQVIGQVPNKEVALLKEITIP
jgi:hypothetical protein